MLPTDDWNKDWFNSAYYQQLKSIDMFEEKTSFIDAIISKYNVSPDSKVLDAACGEGKLAQYISNKGFDTTGADASFYNIDGALELQNEKLHFYQHDFRLPFWIGYFNLAFLSNNGFGHFRTDREHSNAIRTISGALQKDGIFALDFINVEYVQTHFKPKFDRKVEEVNFHINSWFDENYFYKKIIVEDPTQTEPVTYQERTARLKLGDLNEMFSFHDFQIQDVFGDYNLNPYDLNKSERLIIAARKRS